MTNKRTPMVAGNWKMNGNCSLVESFINALNEKAFEKLDVVVCPPSVYLNMFTSEYFQVGAQDVSHLDNGAHTGDISTQMVAEMGAQYVIVGHSERREDHNETNLLVAKKAAKVIESGLIPIICVGEALSVRESGKEKEFVGEQVAALFSELTTEQLKNSVIAYEPVWAIGTGKTASPEQAQDIHQFIRQSLADHDSGLASGLRILYGGSVKPDNAKALFGQPDIDGGLIGGASLKTEDFIAICQAAI